MEAAMDSGLSKSVLTMQLHAVDTARGIVSLNHLPDSLRADRNKRVLCLVDTFLDDPVGRSPIHLALAVDWRLEALTMLARQPDFAVWTLPIGREVRFDPSIAIVTAMAELPILLIKAEPFFEASAFLGRLGSPVAALRQPIDELTDLPRDLQRSWSALKLAWLHSERPNAERFRNWDHALERIESWGRGLDRDAQSLIG